MSIVNWGDRVVTFIMGGMGKVQKTNHTSEYRCLLRVFFTYCQTKNAAKTVRKNIDFAKKPYRDL